jgi:probable F420-dependent oxidoreductase
VKIDTGIGAIEGAAEAARTAEAAGYDGIWAAETGNDPFLALTLAAEHTERVEIGTSITVAFARSPMTLALTAAELQRYSGGRLLLGLGSQVKAHITRRFSMPWGKPAAQMREYILALQAIFTAWEDGTPLKFEGEYYSHTLMTPMFTPPRHAHGAPKIVLAGVGELMTKVAGEVADGFFCHSFTTERWTREHTLPALARGRGGDLAGYEVIAAPFVATGTDEQIEAEIPVIRKRIAFYASTPAYRPVLELHGWDDLGLELTRMSKAGEWDAMGTLIDDEILHAFAVIAPADRIVAAMTERYAGLATRMTFHAADTLPPDQAAEVLSGLRAIPTISA